MVGKGEVEINLLYTPPSLPTPTGGTPSAGGGTWVPPATTPSSLKCRIPKEPGLPPQTIGEHVKRRRLKYKLSQVEAARALEVNASTILNWEKGRTDPPIEAMPTLIEFLGYDPFPRPKNLPQRMLAKRRTMGWSIKDAAKEFEVDEGRGDIGRGQARSPGRDIGVNLPSF